MWKLYFQQTFHFSILPLTTKDSQNALNIKKKNDRSDSLLTLINKHFQEGKKNPGEYSKCGVKMSSELLGKDKVSLLLKFMLRVIKKFGFP